MIAISMSGTTIPHAVLGHYGAGKVMLKPASDGTGVIAGGPVRAILESAGIQNILTKSSARPTRTTWSRPPSTRSSSSAARSSTCRCAAPRKKRGMSPKKQSGEKKTIRVRQVAQRHRLPARMRETLKALGLGKMHRVAERSDTPTYAHDRQDPASGRSGGVSE